MSVPDPPPDLGPVALVRHCREQWRSNQLSRRVLRRMVPWILVLSPLSFLVDWSQDSVMRTIAMGPLGVWTAIVIWVVLPVAWMIVPPFAYARWAYRRTWLLDDELRSAAMPASDRFFAILFPAAAGAASLVVGAWVVEKSVFLVRASFGSASIALPTPLQVVGEALTLGGMLIAETCIVTAVVLRSLVTRRVSASREGRSLLSILVLYLALAIAALPWLGITEALLPHLLDAAEGQSAGRIAINGRMFFADMVDVRPVLEAVRLALRDLGLVVIALLVASAFIRADIALARRILFQ